MFVQFDQQLVTALRPFVEKAGHRIQKDAWIWKDSTELTLSDDHDNPKFHGFWSK